MAVLTIENSIHPNKYVNLNLCAVSKQHSFIVHFVRPSSACFQGQNHGLRTTNEGINQRYLKNWADVADKICFGRI